MRAPASWLSILLPMLALASLCLGAPRLAPLDFLAALDDSGPQWLPTLLLQIRLPRLIAAFSVGIALGIAGVLLQTLSRNRLASPDLLGLNDGALLALSLGLLLSPAGLLAPWWVALIGALATALGILLAAGGVGSQGYRVLIVGLGVAALLRSAFELALSTMPIMHASGIYAFSVGHLGGRTLSLSLIAAAALSVLLLVLIPLRRQLPLLSLSDDSVRSLGVPLRRLRLVVLVLAATLAGLAVSVAGPIAFVAIAAPVLARRFSARSVPLAMSAALGATLVTAADVLGRVMAAPAEVPAGIVTGLLGGPFLLWLLLRGGDGRRS